MKKSQWIDRELITSPVYIGLCVNQAQYASALRKFNHMEGQGVAKNADATTNFFTTDNGKRVAIVCLFKHDYEIEQVHALLAHEAVHIWQEIKNQRKASPEFESYSIQRISQNLFYKYKELLKSMGKRSKKTRKRRVRRQKNMEIRSRGKFKKKHKLKSGRTGTVFSKKLKQMKSEISKKQQG